MNNRGGEMMYISELMTGAPTNERCPLERRMYETLDKLKIPYERSEEHGGVCRGGQSSWN